MPRCKDARDCVQFLSRGQFDNSTQIHHTDSVTDMLLRSGRGQ